MKAGKTKTLRKKDSGTLLNVTSALPPPQPDPVSFEAIRGGPAVVISTTTPTSSPATRRTRKGPVPGTVDRYRNADRALYPEMKRLIGQVMSCRAAAHVLAEANKVSGSNSTVETKARRLSGRYRKDNS